MSKEPLNWDKMICLLGEFRKKFGHCKVPAQWKANPQLGRWVTSLRYRQKMKDLPADQFRQLDALGFVWAANDAAWNRHFKNLEGFKKRYGHCNVPTLWEENLLLAAWVSNQRTHYRQGKLSTGRIQRLEGLGFEWAIHGAQRAVKRRPLRLSSKPVVTDVKTGDERLYGLGNDVYIQYDGVSPMPPELERYMAQRGGVLPSYIPLPKKQTTFFLPHPSGQGLRKIVWSGTGKVPDGVANFLRENGALPAYE